MRNLDAIVIWSVLILLLCQWAGVADGATWRTRTENVQERTIRGRLIRTVEAGGWLVDSGRSQYLILNSGRFVNEPWFREGAEVRAAGEVKRDVATIYMQGIPFEAQSMQPVDGSAAKRVVTVEPDTGAPGEMLNVHARGFPANTRVQIGLGPTESEFEIVKRLRTTAKGTLDTTVRIPRRADPGREWVAVVATQSGRRLNKTNSNAFRVTARVTDEPAEGRDGKSYRIQPGDTLSRLARRFGVTLSEILAANPDIEDPDRIFAGRQLQVPGGQDR